MRNGLYEINAFNKNLFAFAGSLGVGNTPLNPLSTKSDIHVKMTDPQGYLNSTNIFGISKLENPLSKYNISQGIGAMAKTGIGSSILSGVSSAASGFLQNTIGGGLHSGVGNAVGDLGRGVGNLVGRVNPLLGTAINVGSGILDGGINAAIGKSIDEKALAAANETISGLNSYTNTANNFDNFGSRRAFANVGNAYKSGFLNRGWAEDRNAGLLAAVDAANSFAERSDENARRNIVRDQLAWDAANYTALGGALDIMQQDKYINAINNRTQAIAKAQTVPKMTGFAGTANRFDDGGFVNSFMQDPIQAAMQYIQSQDAAEAQQEAAAEAMAQQQAMEDMQQRLANAETQNQGLQALIDSQGLDIKTLMENQRQYTDSWRERMPESNPTDSPVLARIRQGLIDRGINRRAHQDAILANIMVESKGNLNAKNNTSSARGLLQWLKDRHPKAWDFDSQMDYIANTYNQFGGNNWLDKKAWQRFNNTNDSIEAARLFRQYYERPEKHTYNWTDKYINQMYGRKAFGGELGTNGTDFTNGLLEINVGGNHEENPHGGVQLGVDAKGVPNYVEEGETVYKDYVFSKRMNVPAFMRKQLGLGGNMKEDITFADASKKIAEASKERPNNPMDIAGLEAGLGKLAEVQEAERARMQAEEQNAMMETALAMQPANEEEEYAQEAMLEQAMPMDEAAAEQQPAENMMPEEMGLMGALNCYGGKLHGLGGNMFDYGGALNWLRQNHPEMENKEAIAKYLSKFVESNRDKYYDVPDVSLFGNNRSQKVGPRYDRAWRALSPVGNINTSKHIKKWMDLGASKDEAFNAVFPRKEDRDRLWVQDMYKNMSNPKATKTAPSSASGKPIFDWNNLQTETYSPTLQAAAKARSVATTRNRGNITYGKSEKGLQTRTDANGNTLYRAGNGKYYRTEDIALSHTTPKQAVKQAGQAAPANTSVSQDVTTVAQAAPTTIRNTSAARRTAALQPNRGDIVGYKYDWYRNGDDGTGRHWGFTPDENGLIDVNTGYTDDYRNLVSTLTADDIRKWAAEHPNDPSLQSFLANNGENALKDLTDDQWRRGATDGKYGFMHHVAAQIGQNTPGISDEDIQYINNLAGQPGSTAGTENNGATVAGATGNTGNSGSGNTGGGSVFAGPSDWTPKPFDTWMRYAPAFGAGIMTLTDALGLTNKPDYTYANRLEAAARRAGYTPNIRPEYLGDYMNYKPLDRLYYANQLQANARATDRGLQNMSGSNRGTAEAAMLANAANTVQGLGNLDRQGEEYNRGMYERKKEYDRRTNMFNAQMGLEAAMANARYAQQAQNSYISGLAQAAAMRDAIDQRVGASRSANITNFLTSLGNIGRENFAFNQINSDRSRRHAVGRNGVSYDKIARAYTAAFGGEVERFKNKKKGGRK